VSYIQNTLVKGEEILYECDIHWGVFISPAISAVIAVTLFQIDYMFMPIAASLSALIAVLKLYRAIEHFYFTELALTNQRVICKTGLIRRSTYEVSNTNTEGANIDQSILGRILGYGDVVVKGTGGGIAPAPFIKKPLEFRKMLMSQN